MGVAAGLFCRGLVSAFPALPACQDGKQPFQSTGTWGLPHHCSAHNPFVSKPRGFILFTVAPVKLAILVPLGVV